MSVKKQKPIGSKRRVSTEKSQSQSESSVTVSGGNVRTRVQETASQVTPRELTPRRRGRNQAMNKLAAKGR